MLRPRTQPGSLALTPTIPDARPRLNPTSDVRLHVQLQPWAAEPRLAAPASVLGCQASSQPWGSPAHLSNSWKKPQKHTCQAGSPPSLPASSDALVPNPREPARLTPASPPPHWPCPPTQRTHSPDSRHPPPSLCPGAGDGGKAG